MKQPIHKTRPILLPIIIILSIYASLLIQIRFPNQPTTLYPAAPETQIPQDETVINPTPSYIQPNQTNSQPDPTVQPLDPTIIPPTTPPSPDFTTDSIQKTTFQKFIEKITKPTKGTKPSSDPTPDPPPQVDCSTSQDININLNLSCHKNHRTYTTNILIVENNQSHSCNFTIEVDSTSGSSISNNFSSGDADFMLAFTKVNPNDLTTLPEPKTINSWTEWEQSPLQFEIVNGNFQSASPSATYTIPSNSVRSLSLISDCGTDIIQNENIVIKLKSNFND